MSVIFFVSEHLDITFLKTSTAMTRSESPQWWSFIKAWRPYELCCNKRACKVRTRSEKRVKHIVLIYNAHPSCKIKNLYKISNIMHLRKKKFANELEINLTNGRCEWNVLNFYFSLYLYSGTSAIQQLGFPISCDIRQKCMVPKYFC
jgi:hypothetical protein